MISAQAARIKQTLCDLESDGSQEPKPRILFSAHGLPKRTVIVGDPYQWQVEQTVAAIVAELRAASGTPAFDSVVCYQSRVGPMEWIGPPITEEIVRAGEDRVPVIVIPVAFVSEHSETLVELDIECRRFAEEQGVETYIRLPTLATAEPFMHALKDLVWETAESDALIRSCDGPRLCPQGLVHCPQ